MITKNHLIIFLLITAGCQNKEPVKIEITKIDSIKKSLIGKWGGLGESTPVWKITYDSLYKYGENKSYSYIMSGNDLVVGTSEFQFKLKDISVNGDTLYFYTRVSVEEEIYGITKAFRHK